LEQGAFLFLVRKGDAIVKIYDELSARGLIAQVTDEEEIKELNAEQHYNFWNAPHLYKPEEDSETFEMLRERVTPAVMNIVEKHKGQNVLIVTHTMTLKALMTALQNKSISEVWEPPFIKQTSLTVLDFNKDELEILMHGDASHHEYSFKEFNE